MDPTSRVFTVRELARYLRVHSTTVYRLAKTGQLPGFRVGSDWRFRAEDVDRWLKQNVQPLPRPKHNRRS
jgi:excisionase family DNA binding protein